MTTETETVADVLATMQLICHSSGMGYHDVKKFAQRIEAAHARDAKDAARYRAYRATRVKPELFGGDGWSEEDTDRVIDAAMAKQEVIG